MKDSYGVGVWKAIKEWNIVAGRLSFAVGNRGCSFGGTRGVGQNL